MCISLFIGCFSALAKIGSLFLTIGKDCIGIVVGINEDNVTIQDGNSDVITNTFEDANKHVYVKSV